VVAPPKRTRARAKPRATPRIRRSPGATPAASAVTTAQCHPVIVATADPSLTRMLAFALDQARLPHVEFQSGTVVLRELLAMPVTGHPTIVVLDVDLPGVDGHAILERLGVERPDTFLIVVLSSHADESVQVRSLLAGALDHLAKPFNVRVLMAKLLRWTAISARTQVAA
jgi:DNA-binding response OmpR family regulator